MSNWPASKARRVLAALERIGWRVKRQRGSHRLLTRPGVAGLRVRISRSGRDRRANVVTSGEGDWLDTGRPLIHVTAQVSDASPERLARSIGSASLLPKNAFKSADTVMILRIFYGSRHL